MTRNTAAPAHARDFGSPYVEALLDGLDLVGGAAATERALRLAGDTRTAAELYDPTTWSSYAQFRSLLQAAREVLGGLDALTDAVSRSGVAVRPAELNDSIRGLGSLEVMFEHVAEVTASIAPLIRATAQKQGSRDWVVRHVLDGRYEPFEELCALLVAVTRLAPPIFGVTEARVEHVECALRGGSACAVRVTWEDEDEQAHRLGHLERKVEMLQERLANFEQTVDDLAFGADLDTILASALDYAHRSIPSERFVLALRPGTGLSGKASHSIGVRPEDEAPLAELLLSDDRPADWLVAEVASSRCWYGRLAALRRARMFLPLEQSKLDALARLAAVALDSAAAVERARSEGATAEALLDLSTVLAEVTSVEEMAAKLVRAACTVVGSDCAVVSLHDRAAGVLRNIAAVGYPRDIETRLLGQVFPLRSPALVDARHVAQWDVSDFRGEVADVLRDAGAQRLMSLPIVVDGDPVGALIVTYLQAGSLPTGADIESRLRGLAAQASTALRNARLLDQVRHQAFHDVLTGLPNRALILERAEQLLLRARRGGWAPAALFVDLDGFKEINDTFGHAEGDRVLREVTERLKACLRAIDTIGRLGGDEFVVLLEGGPGDVRPVVVAERLLAALREPFATAGPPGTSVPVAGSIGIAVGDRAEVGELLRDADIALYRAKALGKDRFVVFAPEMRREEAAQAGQAIVVPPLGRSV